MKKFNLALIFLLFTAGSLFSEPVIKGNVVIGSTILENNEENINS